MPSDKALSCLTRLASRRPATIRLLEDALSERLAEIGEGALEVAMELGDPMGHALADCLRRRPHAVVAEQLGRRVVEPAYRRSTPLWEVAEVALGQALEHSKNRPGLTERRRGELANMLHVRGDRLADLGRLQEAFEVTLEAVRHWQALSEIQPDAWRPRLAASWSSLAHRSSLLGRWDRSIEAGERAVEIYRELVAENPSELGSSLAGALVNLGQVYAHAGEWREALSVTEEAAGCYRDREASGSDDHFATCLMNLGQLLQAQNRRRESLEALDEAVRFLRLHYAQEPDAYSRQLAAALAARSTLRHDRGDREGALADLEEAQSVVGDLIRRLPDAFGPLYAGTLLNLGNQLGSMGQFEKAFEVTGEAIRRLLPFAARFPETSRDLLFALSITYQQAGEDSKIALDPDLLHEVDQLLSDLAGEGGGVAARSAEASSAGGVRGRATEGPS